jgi:predicted metal-binding membrane protein
MAATPRRVFRLIVRVSHPERVGRFYFLADHRSLMLSAAGLIRTSRRGGFCPACRLLQSDAAPREIAAPALIALVFLIVAALAWAVTIARMRSMDDMRMGLGALDAFVVGWLVMMVAMMLPSALPLVFEFARNAEGRRGWRVATALVGVTYLGIWMVFGVVCYAVYNVVGMPWPNQALVGGAALMLAGLYAMTPLKRISEARCRELAALHAALPFNLMRSALLVGVRYSLSCLGCTGALMLAMVLIGTANLTWMLVLSAVTLIYKLAPRPPPRLMLVLSASLICLGVLYASQTM